MFVWTYLIGKFPKCLETMEGVVTAPDMNEAIKEVLACCPTKEWHYLSISKKLG